MEKTLDITLDELLNKLGKTKEDLIKMRRTQRMIVKQTEEWLDERWSIAHFENPPRQPDSLGFAT